MGTHRRHNMAIAMFDTMLSSQSLFGPYDLFSPRLPRPSLDQLMAANWPSSSSGGESYFYQSSTTHDADGLKRKLVTEEHEDANGNAKRVKKRQIGRRSIIETESGDGEVKRRLKNMQPDEVEKFEQQWGTSGKVAPKKAVRFAREKDTQLYDALDAEVVAAKTAAEKAAKEAAEAKEQAEQAVAARKAAEEAAAAKEAAARKAAEEAAAAKEAAMIDELVQYGFEDRDACKAALKQSQGDLKAAIKMMVGALTSSA